MSEAGAPDGPQDNGLRAATYVPLTDVELVMGQQLLTALGRARIAAYLAPSDSGTGAEQRRLFVASDERGDARTIVAAAVRAISEHSELPAPRDDGLGGLDTDAVFEAMVADWHVDTHTAIRKAERDLTREDADWRARLARPPAGDELTWLDDDHYVPPPPPPLPRLHLRTVLAIVLLAASIALLGFGVAIGLPGDLGFILGILGVLGSGAIFLSRLRTTSSEDGDDGSAV